MRRGLFLSLPKGVWSSPSTERPLGGGSTASTIPGRPWITLDPPLRTPERLYRVSDLVYMGSEGSSPSWVGGSVASEIEVIGASEGWSGPRLGTLEKRLFSKRGRLGNPRCSVWVVEEVVEEGMERGKNGAPGMVGSKTVVINAVRAEMM